MTNRRHFGYLHRQAFNMVEIALALAVIGIALLAVTSLIPIGAKATSDATGENYAAMASEQMLEWLANNARTNWAGTIQGTAIPTSPPDISGVANDSWDDLEDAGAAPDDPLTGTGSLYDDLDEDGVYRVIQRTRLPGGTETVIDADVIIRIWKEPIVSDYTYTTASGYEEFTDTTFDHYARINIEASWPKDIPYAARAKAYYTIEVSNN